MFKNKLFLLFIGIVGCSTFSNAQNFTDLSKQIPFDSTIRKGVLPNGLTYYIKHNETPKHQASYYIIHNVGAVLETDAQNGLAHFLEHMAFNGTTNFPGKSLLNMLENKGVKFGKDANAYTTQNETVYNISRVPSTNPKLIDSCLMVLRDWSNSLTLDTKEIDAERGVITEEWRGKQGANFRNQAKLRPTLYNNSIYSQRDVIGSMDVVKNFSPDELRSFYHDWYRPDLQAIAIVGDIDVDAVEQQVIKMFSIIPMVKNPKKRFFATIPDNKEPLYALVSDKENKNVEVSLLIRSQSKNDNTLASLRESYISKIFNALIKGRFQEITQKGRAPFMNGGISHGSLVRGYNGFKISAGSSPGNEARAFEAVYTELQKVIKYGFTQTELERLKTSILVAEENSYLKREQISSEDYCNSIKNNYLNQSAIPNADFSYQFAKEIIPTITVEEVSAFASQFLTAHNRVYSVVGPDLENLTTTRVVSDGSKGLTTEKAIVKALTLKEIEDIIAKVEKKEITAYVDNTPLNAQLLSTTPVPGTIVNEKEVPEFKAIEWTLSNGAKVVYRFADYQKNTVALKATSYGGTSIYESKDIPSVGAISSYVDGFGIGQYDGDQFKKIMSGKSANSKFSIDPNSESITASSTPADIETMLQLVYMRFEEPRFDKEKFNNIMFKNYKELKSQVKTPQAIIKDTLRSIEANGNPRTWKFDKKYLETISFNRMKEIYKERFSNASDFTFFIVGDIDAETLKPLVEKYIGSLKGTGQTEKWVDRGNFFPNGHNTHRIAVPMTEQKATALLKLKAEAKYTRETVVYHTILGSVLNLRFNDNIREKEGGTYGVRVTPGATLIPKTNLSLEITFDCDPQKVDYLKTLVYKELDIIQKKVVQSDLDKVVLNMKKNSENSRENNSYWMTALEWYYNSNENILKPSFFDDIINTVTPEDIEKAAAKFLKKADILDIIIVPKTMI